MYLRGQINAGGTHAPAAFIAQRMVIVLPLSPLVILATCLYFLRLMYTC